MSIISKRNYWEIRVTKTINSKRKDIKKQLRKDSFTKGQAAALEKKLLRELEDKIANEVEKASPRLIENVIDAYLSFKEPSLSFSTYYARDKNLRAHTKHWNGKLLNEITPSEIQKYIETVKVSYSTKKEIKKAFFQLFEFAIEMGILNGRNPVKNIYVSKGGIAHAKNSNLSAMTRNEVENLFTHLRGIKSQWFDIFYITYMLGLRSAEAQGLQWKDVDLSKRRVSINKSWNEKTKAFIPTKNGEERSVSISDELNEFLKNMYELKLPRKEDFVLPRLSPWLKGRAAEVLRDIQKELGIRETNYHALRASFITHLLEAGASPVHVQDMVGHKDWATTKRYIRLTKDYLSGITNTLDFKQASLN